MNIQMTLALRYMAGRKLRTTLTILAIMFGVLVLFGMNSLLPAMLEAFQINAKAAAGEVDATVTLKSSDAFQSTLVERVASVEGVRAVSGYLSRPVNVPSDYFDADPRRPDQVTLVSLVGLNITQATAIHAYPIQEGRFLEAGDRQVAVISESLARALDLQVGDSFHLPLATGEVRLEVVGLLPARAAAGNEQILVTLDQAQRMLAMPGMINAVDADFGNVDSTQRAEIETRILRAVGDSFQLGSLSSNDQFLTTLGLSQVIFNLLGVMALLMGGFIIFNTFRTLVAERRRDIGMLRTLGANRRMVILTILSEGLLQGIIGTALGLILGYLLARALIAAIGPMLGQFVTLQLGDPVVTPGLVIGSVIMGLGVTLLAGLLPALSASRVTPLEALRPAVGEVSLKRMAGWGFWSGALMLVVSVLLLLSQEPALLSLGGLLFIVGLFLATPALVTPIANFFGRLLALVYARSGTADLAQGNLARQPARAATTASTTMIALAIIIMVASLVSSLQIGFARVMRKSLGADFLALPPSVTTWGTNVGASQVLRDSLRSVQGVDVLSTFRFAPTRVGDTAIEIMGIDPATFLQVSGLEFIAGDEAGAYQELEQGRAMIINGIMSTTLGVALGDQVALLTPQGPRSYRVVGVAADFLNAKIPTATLAQANLEADFGVNEEMLFLINATDGADREQVEAGLRGVLQAYPQFQLIDGQAYIEQNLALFQAALGGLTAMLLFLSIPSLIAMVNTLAIGVIERTREIGMLRAIGATRKQVRRVILAEALILSALGTLFGVLAGLYLGYLLVQALGAGGFPTEYAFPAPYILLALAAGVFFGLIAAIIPARQASRLQVVEALRYE